MCAGTRAALLAAVLFAPVVSAQYSIPWQLRPTAATNVVRTDNALAFHEDTAGNSATTVASLLFASYKVTKDFAPFVRWGAVVNPVGEGTATSFVNPALGGTWALQLSPDVRLALFLGLTVPVGAGGGNSPSTDKARATRAGVLARSAMDNAMFAVNDFTVFPGVGLSFVKGAFTAQVEATVLRLTRVRGEALQADASRTNFTSGVHLGYYLVPQVSLGAELRYQRWLSTPVAVTAAPPTRDTLSAAAGVRAHLEAGGLTFRPGVAYAMGLDDPMSAQAYRIIHLDMPVAF